MSEISYQLYSSRNFGPLPETLKMLAELGYKNVEGFGGILNDAEGLAADLAANGLSMPTTHIGLDQVEADPDGVIAMARTLGLKTLYVPHIMPDDRPTDGAGWAAFAERVMAAGAPLRAAGFGFGWHNHDFEFVAGADGIFPMEAMLEAAPEMEVELDIAWVQKAGQDPVQWIEKLKGRITAAHVKDIAPAGECQDEDGWADVGHGTMDWGAINAALANTGAKYGVNEHDNPNDDKRFASRSIASATAF